ncbi:flagellin [Aestuariirhabdus litorea]|uniref:Flagellin n=1 Tax=Aestuariirhabdus litorea TaxID=2528527 RepID=A0A3P3VWA7_9GAMM|nr:flagellin [Aestuariirhabdus litorea]RRJ85003.1 flagellin [Aestuariirhabdus litorea]RWW98228.1 flagellin [Endozoicomonadaceae bacterium GTF-13]
MALTVQTNVASLNTQRNLNNSSQALDTSMQRLSTGYRINSAKDDAAGLQISNRLTSQINGLHVAVRNANDGISLSQTAEGALQQSTDILQRMRDLSLQSANGSNGATERQALNSEVSQLQQELNRVADTTTFGGLKLLDGSYGTKQFQVGANANETIGVAINSARATDIGANRHDVTYSATGQYGVVLPAAGAAVPNATTGGDLTLTGGNGSAIVTIGAATSAADYAAAVNSETGTTGVSADARTALRLENLSAAGGFTMTINGQAVAAIISSPNDLRGLATAINAQSGTTGVAATLTDNNASIELVNEAGDDIVIGDFVESTNNGATIDVQGLDYSGTDTGQAVVTLTETTAGNTRAIGNVRFESSDSFQLTGSVNTLLDGAATAATSTLTSVDTIDISTQQGAQDAIGVLDAAIAGIDSNRAELGAVQNRFEFTISNLQNIAENSSAARSRIKDTDYAAETSELAKNQVLQQAGTSILAQANQLPQSVLSLLGQ